MYLVLSVGCLLELGTGTDLLVVDELFACVVVVGRKKVSMHDWSSRESIGPQLTTMYGLSFLRIDAVSFTYCLK